MSIEKYDDRKKYFQWVKSTLNTRDKWGRGLKLNEIDHASASKHRISGQFDALMESLMAFATKIIVEDIVK